MILEKKYLENIKTAAVLIVIISLAGKGFGFLRELLLAKYFGTSSIVDVYIMSYTIPAILFGSLPAIGTGFTPIYYSINSSEKRFSFLNNIIISCIVLSLVCILFTYIFSYQIVDICANGFDTSLKYKTAQFLRITVLSILFNAIVQVLTSYLNCNKQYVASNLSNLLVSVTQALFVILAANFNTYLLPIGFVAPYILQFVWLYNCSKSNGFVLRKEYKYDENIKTLLIFSIPICISSLLVDINGFVDKFLASSLPEGALASLNYSFTLRAVIATVFNSIVATIFYPKISEMLARKDDNISALVERTFDFTTIIVAPLNVYCIYFGMEIVSTVLMRGSFDNNSLVMTYWPFVMYMISLTFIVWRELFIRILFANMDNKANLCFGALTVFLNIFLSIIMVQKIGHIGLALATSLAAIIIFPLYLYKLTETVNFNLRNRFNCLAKVLISIFAALVPVGFVKKNGVVFSNLPLELSVFFVAFIIIYVGAMYILKVPEIINLKNLLTERIFK